MAKTGPVRTSHADALFGMRPGRGSGTTAGKTHMAIVLTACRVVIQSRFFTASCLIGALLRSKDEDRFDRELPPAKNQLLIVDELWLSVQRDTE